MIMFVQYRTFDLFEKLGMHEQCDAEKAEKGDLIRYYLTEVNNPFLYNDVQVVPPFERIGTKEREKIKKGPTASTFDVTGIEDWYVSTLPHLNRLQ